ncbi:uncharacterized protein LOC122379507 [Amphibalanus amphitrite]|uniref:uncharacterized protein LOC122379507 n=1 Tax=Amphibalanus amphitrite TaxID=1232801 RepID=UPI001C8FBD46|nr:uncharacterized protein LOC122379507 [Amphibalanus amphitrite]
MTTHDKRHSKRAQKIMVNAQSEPVAAGSVCGAARGDPASEQCAARAEPPAQERVRCAGRVDWPDGVRSASAREAHPEEGVVTQLGAQSAPAAEPAGPPPADNGGPPEIHRWTGRRLMPAAAARWAQHSARSAAPL